MLAIALNYIHRHYTCDPGSALPLQFGLLDLYIFIAARLQIKHEAIRQCSMTPLTCNLEHLHSEDYFN